MSAHWLKLLRLQSDKPYSLNHTQLHVKDHLSKRSFRLYSFIYTVHACICTSCLVQGQGKHPRPRNTKWIWREKTYRIGIAAVTPLSSHHNTSCWHQKHHSPIYLQLCIQSHKYSQRLNPYPWTKWTKISRAEDHVSPTVATVSEHENITEDFDFFLCF